MYMSNAPGVSRPRGSRNQMDGPPGPGTRCSVRVRANPFVESSTLIPMPLLVARQSSPTGVVVGDLRRLIHLPTRGYGSSGLLAKRREGDQLVPGRRLLQLRAP